MAAYYAVFGGRYSVFELRSARAEQAALTQDLDSLLARNARLEARIDSLETNPHILERVAREEYGLIMPGERLYRPTEPDTTAHDEGAEAY